MQGNNESLREMVRARKDRQLATNAARNIANEVKRWSNAWQEAGDRWPWELLQNARDTAVSNKRTLKASFSFEGAHLVFAHDGGPFSFDDITALILGGSAKIYDSSSLTGRFGTGFLVTHAISARVSISGQSEGGSFFQMDFDRRGSQADIEANIRRSEDQLDCSPTGSPGLARFEYQDIGLQGKQVVEKGLDALDSVLPYVFCFNPAINEVTIVLPGSTVIWIAEPSRENETPSISVARIRRVHRNEIKHFKVYESHDTDNSRAAALMCENRDQMLFLPPSSESLRIYKEFPLLRSAKVGLPVCLNAPFDVDETRSADFLGKDSGSQITGQTAEKEIDSNQKLAFSAVHGLPDFLQFISTLDSPNSHLALQISLPGERLLANSRLWRAALAGVVENLKSRRLVRGSKSGELLTPQNCYFVLPLLSRSNANQRVEAIDFWRLVNRFGILNLPAETIASDWATIVEGWKSLGVTGITVWTVEDLIKRVRASKSISALAQDLEIDQVGAVRWIGELLELITPLRQELKVGILEQLLPNQDGILKSPADLFIDRAVDEELKTISASVGTGLSGRLLDKRILDGAGSERRELIEAFVQNEIETGSALKRIIEDVRLKLSSFPQHPRQGESILKSKVAMALAKLTVWCAMHRPVYDDIAKDLPILTEEGRLEKWADKYVCHLPVQAWPPDAQLYEEIFPDSRKLASIYWEAAGDHSDGMREALVEWGICPEGLVSAAKSQKIPKATAHALRCGNEGVEELEPSYQCEKCSQVPFITELIGWIGTDRARAAQFLNFLLLYVADRDELWKLPTLAQPISQRGLPLLIRPATWLAHARKDAWVPKTEPGTTDVIRVIPNRESLIGIVPWQELRSESPGVNLLELLGFDQLELYIQVTTQGQPEAEKLLRDDLARIVQEEGLDGLHELRQVLEERKARKNTIAQNRDRGLHVQDRVKELLEMEGKEVEVVDRGYDFLVYERGEADPDSDWGLFSAGKYLVEVKATRGDEVRFTPLQAKTSSQNSSQYVLFVIDLRQCANALPTNEEVLDNLHISEGVGDLIRPLFDNVSSAESDSAGIRIDPGAQLRYCISESIWQPGWTLSEWISRSF